MTVVRKPSQWWYALGAAVIVLGMAGFFVYMATQSDKIMPDTRVVVPGTVEVELDHVGRYTIFYEYRSVVDGRTYSTPEHLSGIAVSLTAKDGSQPVDLSEPSTKSIYRSDRYEGISVLEFRIEEPGTYVFAAAYDQGRAGSDVVYALGQTNTPAVFGITAFAIGFGSLVIGGSVIAVTFVRRRTAASGTRSASTSDAAQA